MTQTRSAYIATEKALMLEDGLTISEINGFNFDNEYYDLVKEHIKQGNSITNEVYKDLTEGQRYHFNKHYGISKIIDSDYVQGLRESKKLNDEKFNKYLLEKEIERKEQEQRDLEIKQKAIKELTEELERLKNKLYDYNKLSPIGKRNITEIQHNKRQEQIKNMIIELKNNLSQLAG